MRKRSIDWGYEMSEETREQIIEKYGEVLAKKLLRYERSAFYGDLKPIDKMKNMRKEVDLQYKNVEIALEVDRET